MRKPSIKLEKHTDIEVESKGFKINFYGTDRNIYMANLEPENVIGSTFSLKARAIDELIETLETLRAAIADVDGSA